MILSSERTKELIEETEIFMQKLGVPIRDTWTGYDGENKDDLFTNEGYNGPKLVTIEIAEFDIAHALECPVYPVDGFKSYAYDKFSICIPKRHANHCHIFIHEIVHFLQRTCEELGETYKKLKSHSYEDYQDYVNQRCEREAHFVQLNYINQKEQHLVRDNMKQQFSKMISDSRMNGPEFALDCIDAKEWGILV